MRRLLLLPLAAAALLAGCPPDTSLPVSEECASNSAPYIDNLEINSRPPITEEGEPPAAYGLCLKFDWFDPGPDENGNVGSDAPNMFGGLFSVEVGGFDAESIWLDEDTITQGAPSGTIEYTACLQEAVADELIHFNFRVRDRCGASSNEKSGDYYLGGGPGESHLVENPETGEDGCIDFDLICDAGATE